jgi:BirA family biotin operon repressor/biotin-[acetyl-CoA-carboxylase] ligase
MIDVAGTPLDRTAVLIALLERLATRQRMLAVSEIDVFERWRPYCVLTGKRVCLNVGTRDVDGVCQGIDDSGRLVIATAQGTEVHRSGTVVSFA